MDRHYVRSGLSWTWKNTLSFGRFCLRWTLWCVNDSFGEKEHLNRQITCGCAPTLSVQWTWTRNGVDKLSADDLKIIRRIAGDYARKYGYDFWNTGTIFDTIVREMFFPLDLIEDRDFPKRGIRLPLFSWTELAFFSTLGSRAASWAHILLWDVCSICLISILLCLQEVSYGYIWLFARHSKQVFHIQGKLGNTLLAI